MKAPFFRVIAEMEEEQGKPDYAIVGRIYSLQAGTLMEETRESVDPEGIPQTPIMLEVSVHVSDSGLELTTRTFYQNFLFDSTKDTYQHVIFSFQATKYGRHALTIDFYHERHWLQTFKIEFKAR